MLVVQQEIHMHVVFRYCQIPQRYPQGWVFWICSSSFPFSLLQDDEEMLVTSRNNSYGRNTYLPTWSLLSFALLKALLLTLATSVSVTLLSRGASNLCTGLWWGRPQQRCTAGTFLLEWRRECRFLTLYMTLGVSCVTCGVVVYMTGIVSFLKMTQD